VYMTLCCVKGQLRRTLPNQARFEVTKKTQSSYANLFHMFSATWVHSCIYWLTLLPCNISDYAALLPRRGPHIASHSVCLSICPSVCPSVPLSLTSVTSRHQTNYNDTHVLFGTHSGHPYFLAHTPGIRTFWHELRASVLFGTHW